MLAKPIKQNKNNNNSDGTPLLGERKQHKRRKRKDLPHKNPSKVRLLNKRHKRKVRVRGL